MNKDILKEVKKELRLYRNIDRQIKLLEIQKRYVEDDIDVSSVDMFSQKTSKTNKIYSSVEDSIIKRENELKKLTYMQNRLLNKKDIINIALEMLEDREREIIELRYFEGRSWVSVADIVILSLDSCIKINRKALITLSEHIL